MIGSINPLWLLVTFALLGADCQPLSDEQQQVASDYTELLQYDSVPESSTSAEQKPRKIFEIEHGGMKIRAPLFDDEFVCSPEKRKLDIETMEVVKSFMTDSYSMLNDDLDLEALLSEALKYFAMSTRDLRIASKQRLEIQPTSEEFIKKSKELIDSITTSTYPIQIHEKSEADLIASKLLEAATILARDIPPFLSVDWAGTTIDEKSLKDFAAPLIRYLRYKGRWLYLSALKIALNFLVESA